MRNKRIDLFPHLHEAASQVAHADKFHSKVSIHEMSRCFFGAVTVVRLTDRRKLFPFLGAPKIGPFDTFAEAKAAADSMILKVIADDIANPES